MNRRFWLSLCAGALVFSAVFSTAQAAASARSTGKVQRSAARTACKPPKGTIRFSDWQWPDTLNPMQSRLLVTNEITAGIDDPLFVFNNRGDLSPVIAASVPTVANGGITDGGRTVTIHLRHGLRWSDGSEITSRDLQFSLAVEKDPASGPYCRSSCNVISRIDTPDRYTAVLRLHTTYSPILAYGLPVLWPHKWKGAWNNNAHAAASKLWDTPSFNFEGPNYPTDGAYQVAPGGFKPQTRVILRPMKYYHTLGCGARAATVVFTYFESKFDMVTAAVKHQTDITQDYTLDDAPALYRHTKALHVTQQPAYSFEHLDLNTDAKYGGKPNPLANTSVRLALALALDKAHLAQSALGIAPQLARSIVAWTPLIDMPGLVQPFADRGIRGQWDPLQRKYVSATGAGRALTDAKKLLAATPYKGGFTVDLVTILGNPVRQAQVGILATAWAKLGVKIKAQYLPASLLFGDWPSKGTLDHGNFQVAMYGSTTSPDPDQLKFNLMGKFCDRSARVHSDLNGNYSCMHDASIDHGFVQGAASLNPTVRAAAYAAVQTAINRKAYWIPLYYRPQLTTDDGRVANFRPNPTEATSEWNMAQWSVK